MSVYFHTEDGDGEVVRLSGSERAYASGVCSDLFLSAMDLTGYVSEDRIAQYRTLFPADHYVQRLTGEARYITSSVCTAMVVGREFVAPILNTALVMGSDAVKLLARLHGQCELHAYVEGGGDRAWLADIIEGGRTRKVLRANMGWERVTALLRASAAGPIVLSYSVCHSFPNAAVAGWQDEHDGEDFYALPRAEQWRRGMIALRAEPSLRLDPDTWADFWFGDQVSAFDLLGRLEPAAVPPRLTP